MYPLLKTKLNEDKQKKRLQSNVVVNYLLAVYISGLKVSITKLTNKL